MDCFKLEMDFVDNYILKAPPEYAIVYIYAYRHKTEDYVPSVKEISKALSLPQTVVNDATKYWIKKGFDIFSIKTLPPSPDKSLYSPKEITSFVLKDKSLATLYEEVEKILNKPLSTNDQQTLFWIYNDLGMSSAVIILMLNYACSINKGKIRYIEKLAMEWSDKGIVEFDDAEKHLAQIERCASYEGRIKKLFGIDRNFTSTEKALITDWCNVLKPTKGDLLAAYDICIERTGKFSAKYINAILTNWKENGQGRKSDSPGNVVPTPKATKFNNFTSNNNIDYKKIEKDAMKKRLSKIGGEAK